jgi:hypothetical protein
MRFWVNVGVIVGFMSFSLPITTKPAIRYRFLKGMAAGTLGVIAFAPVHYPMLFGLLMVAWLDVWCFESTEIN